MQSEDSNLIKSKCFACKFGHCMLQETQAQAINDLFSSPGEEEDIDLGTWEEDNHHNKAEQRIVAVCYYSPEGSKDNSPAIIPGIVRVCNRFAKDT